MKKNKIIIKKIAIVLMILVMIIQITPTSFAGLKLNSKVSLKSKGMLDCLLQFYSDEWSDWSYKVGYYIYYQDEELGKKVPALCVEPSREGVGELGSYDTTIDVCNDNGIYTILYLYNNKKYADWGLKNTEDYYLAAQTAMHCYADKVKPKDRYRVGDRVLEGYTPNSLDEIKQRGKTVLNTAQSLYDSAIKNEYKQQDLKIGIEEKSEWKEETINSIKYYSKQYKIQSNYDLKFYKVEVSSVNVNTTIFTLKNKRVNNNEKMEEENFKISIPKDEFNRKTTVNGNIKITATSDEIPVAVYANSKNTNKQNYAIYTYAEQQAKEEEKLKLLIELDELVINKIDSATGEKLEGASFDIYVNKKDADGNYIFNDETYVCTTNKTNINGEVSVPLEKAGEYIIKEKESPIDYALSEEIIEFSIKTGLESKDITISMNNNKIKGKIEITKISKEYNQFTKLEKGQPLEGAKYLIENSEGKTIGTYTTDEKGKILTEDLECGEYKICEIESPQYYNVNSEPQSIIIDENNKVYSVVFENESSKVELNIEKSGDKEAEIGKIIEYSFDNLENKSNVPVDNFVWKDVLPIDAIRLTKIETGTWNEELEYSIWYKTNLQQEYKMHTDKLNSKKNYTFKISDFGLKEDEYVTEYELRFGTVKRGFKEEINPRIYCKVLKNLKNGYEFINNTYLTATYFEEKIEVIDNWKTIIYTKEKVPAKQKLPKTGC